MMRTTLISIILYCAKSCCRGVGLHYTIFALGNVHRVLRVYIICKRFFRTPKLDFASSKVRSKEWSLANLRRRLDKLC